MNIKKYFDISVIGGGKRKPEVDVAKGIGIILVVLAHCSGGSILGNLINAFHMPLFFCLSGLFLFHKNESFKRFLNKKAKSLLFPCLVFGILLSTYSTALDYVRGESEIPLEFRYVGLFINTRHNPYPGSLWFFLALFLVELMLYFIHKTIRSNAYRLIIVLAISIMGCFYNHMYKVGLPWSLDIALICMFFTEVGNMCKQYVVLSHNSWLKGVLSLFVFIVAFYLNEVYLGNNVNLFSSDYGCYPLFYMAAFSGTFIAYSLASIIKHNQILQYLGQNSLLIYSLHFLLLLVVSITYSHIPINGILSSVAQTITIILLLIPVINIINKHFVWMTGKI